jgi:hypothetical protein
LQRFAPLENRDDFVVVVLLFGFSSSSSCPAVVVVFIFCSPPDASKPPLPLGRGTAAYDDCSTYWWRVIETYQ